MIEFLLLVVQQTWVILKDASVYLLFGFVIAGALAVLVPAKLMLRVFGSGRVKSVLWGAAIGAPLPLCSCGVLPAALALRREGATDGATAAFLIATPETGVDSIAVSYALTDPLMTVARPVAGVATAVSAGLATNFLGGRDGGPAPRAVPASEAAIPAPHAHDKETAHDYHHDHTEGHAHADAPLTLSWAGVFEATRRIGHYAFRDLLDDTSHWLVLGIVLSGVFAALLPGDLIERYLGSGIYPMLIMLLIGIPMYTCASASTPIAAALVMKGLSPGAALCFLLGGPATNVGSLVVLVRFFGLRFVAIYLASIAVVALIAGLTIDWIYRAWAIDPRATFGAAAIWMPEPVKVGGAIVFLALLTASLLRARMPQEAAWVVAGFTRLTGIDFMSRRVRLAALALPVALYLGSGFFVVAPGETAIGLRFGEVVAADLAPGLHYRMPWPIGSHLLVDRDLVRRLEIGMKKERKEAAPRAPSLMFGAVPAAKSAVMFRKETAPAESFLLTGDGNLIDLRTVVQYRVKDALAFTSSVHNPELLLRNASLAALRVAAARNAIDAIYTAARNDLEHETARSIQEFLDLCRSGIEIVSVRFLYVHAPEEVHDAFRDVASAQEDKLRTVNRAAAFAIERINERKAEAVGMTEQALAFKEERIRRAEGDAAAFRIRLQSYGDAPEITKFRLRIESAETALQGIPKVVTPGAGGVKDLDMWLFQPFVPGGKK